MHLLPNIIGLILVFGGNEGSGVMGEGLLGEWCGLIIIYYVKN